MKLLISFIIIVFGVNQAICGGNSFPSVSNAQLPPAWFVLF
jgi:hypothetical protein